MADYAITERAILGFAEMQIFCPMVGWPYP
jgi:hypothetical protein